MLVNALSRLERGKKKSLDGKAKRIYHVEFYKTETLKIFPAKTKVKQTNFTREVIGGLILKYQRKLAKVLANDAKDSIGTGNWCPKGVKKTEPIQPGIKSGFQREAAHNCFLPVRILTEI